MKHTCREQNRVADALAKSRDRDVIFGQLQVLTFPPMCAAEALATDRLENAFPRKVAICNSLLSIDVLAQSISRADPEPPTLSNVITDATT